METVQFKRQAPFNLPLPLSQPLTHPKKNLLAKSQGANTVLINIKPCVTKLFLSLLLNTLWIIC